MQNEQHTNHEDLEGDVLIGEFIAQFDSGAGGVVMDVDTAQALAKEFKRMAEFGTALREIQDLTSKRQLPLTTQINDIATDALAGNRNNK